MAKPPVMRPATHTPHRTVIDILQDAMRTWMRARGASMASVVQEVVEAHERLGADQLTRITFEAGRDAHDRMRINAERVFRWLDEVSKANNLLPVNFLPSLLAGLPLDLRMQAGNEILRAAGLGVHPLERGRDEHALVEHFRAVLSDGRDAELALAQLLDGIEAGELERAQRELAEDIAARQAALAAVERLLTGRTA